MVWYMLIIVFHIALLVAAKSKQIHYSIDVIHFIAGNTKYTHFALYRDII
jgi:hypothetical protein